MGMHYSSCLNGYLAWLSASHSMASLWQTQVLTCVATYLTVAPGVHGRPVTNHMVTASCTHNAIAVRR